jgi:orotate phosphoribosyltransferase
MTPSATDYATARLLVETGAIAFRADPFFTFTSGARSPVYVDNRTLLGHVAQRRAVVDQLVDVVNQSGVDSLGAIAGTATAGIPWAAWVADRMSLPMLYVRSGAKNWGKQRAVEGTAPDGAHVVLVEDLAFTAGSLGSSTEQLRLQGFVVDLAVTIVSYEMPMAHQRALDLGLTRRTLTTIDVAIEAAVDFGSLTADDATMIGAWLDDLRAEWTANQPNG